MKSYFRSISILACVLVFVVAIALSFHLDQKVFAVEKIEALWTPASKEYCSQQKLLCVYLQSELNKMLLPSLNSKIWQVDIVALRQKVMQNNWYRSVAITRLFPNQLSLSIEVEAPVALIVYNSEILAVADNGELLPTVQISYLPSLPILKGENFFKNLATRKLATEFLRSLSENAELSEKTIAEMTYSKDENFSLLVLPSKSIVRMGADQVALKAARVAQVIEYLNTNQMNGRVIDARFSKKVLVRLRKGS